MIIFLSLTCFTFFFSMELLTVYLEMLPLEIGREGQMGKSTYAKEGGRSKRTRTYDRGGGKIFAILVPTHLLNDPFPPQK